MKWLKRSCVALVFGALITFLGFNALLWGMPYKASPFRHAVAFIGAVLLYPGDVFGGEKGLAVNCVVWTVAAFAFLAWRSRKQQDPRTA
jgi:hypothetical protein